MENKKVYVKKNVQILELKRDKKEYLGIKVGKR